MSTIEYISSIEDLLAMSSCCLPVAADQCSGLQYSRCGSIKKGLPIPQATASGAPHAATLPPSLGPAAPPVSKADNLVRVAGALEDLASARQLHARPQDALSLRMLALQASPPCPSCTCLPCRAISSPHAMYVKGIMDTFYCPALGAILVPRITWQTLLRGCAVYTGG